MDWVLYTSGPESQPKLTRLSWLSFQVQGLGSLLQSIFMLFAFVSQCVSSFNTAPGFHSCFNLFRRLINQPRSLHQTFHEANPDLNALNERSWVINHRSTVLNFAVVFCFMLGEGSLCFCTIVACSWIAKSCGSQAFPHVWGCLIFRCGKLLSVILVNRLRPANSIDGAPLVMVTHWAVMFNAEHGQFVASGLRACV